MMRTQMNIQALRAARHLARTAVAAALALLGGCAHSAPTASLNPQSQLQPGRTIAVSDALGARVFASSPKAVAARRVAAQTFAAAHE